MGCGGSKDNTPAPPTVPTPPAEPAAAPSAAPSAPASGSVGTLYYFAGLKSRGEPTQMIAKYGGVDMSVELISFEQWGGMKSEATPHLPFIKQPDGTPMNETEVICKFLAEKGGKFVVDAKQEELCKIANSHPMATADPLWNVTVEMQQAFGVNPDLATWVEAVTPVLKDLVSKLGDGPFFAGEKPGYGEAYIFHNLDNQFLLAKPELTASVGADGIAKLEAFHAKFAALDGIKEYLAERKFGTPNGQYGVPGSKANPIADAPAEPAAAAGPFSFASGLPDCCAASPDLYKTIAEIEGVARLVEMTFPPGAKDLPHEHPVHNMYFIKDAKLKISGPPTPTTLGEEGAVAEVPAGAAPIFPAMAHQVENVSDTDGHAIFIEAYPGCKPCGTPEGYISPFAASPGCYKLLAEDGDWITGILTMEVGEKDEFHHHRDHLIYVLEGDGVTINPGGDESAAMVVPLKVGAGIPAPMAAPPFASHTLVNSGTVPLKLVFFESKN